jgi:hypothetical protein
MVRSLLLAEELALVAVNEDSGRHRRGARSQLHACLAALLVAELVLDGHAEAGDRAGTFVLTPCRPPKSPTLAAAAHVVAGRGPKIKAVLSHMDRGLRQQLGRSTWDAAILGLIEVAVLAPAQGRFRPRHEVIDRDRRQALLARLRQAGADDRSPEPRTALLLAMTGPAALLATVAPERAGRRHARRRIDHVLDGTPYEPISKAVRQLIADAQAAAAVSVALSSGSC